MPYHVRVTPTSSPSHDEVKLDLTQEMLEKRFLAPYREGRPIVIGGRTIPPDDIQRIVITYTKEDSDQLFPLIRAERQASSVFLPISEEWYVANRGKDVTDDFITGPPGEGLRPMLKTASGPNAAGPRAVFVVHGRNSFIRDSMFLFLRTIGLHPIEWNEALHATGRPSPYIGEVLDKAFDTAQAILVLFTPDDEACLREAYRGPSEPAHETDLTPQARANVLFEAGMAMGRNAERTVLVEVGHLRPFSDIGGRHVVRLDNTTPRRQELAQRLENAGCPVNLKGTDWHTTGDFDI